MIYLLTPTCNDLLLILHVKYENETLFLGKEIVITYNNQSETFVGIWQSE